MNKYLISILVFLALIGMGAIAYFWDYHPFPAEGGQIVSVFNKESSSPAPEPETSEMVFGGDVMLGRYVETLMRERGETYPALQVRDILRAADYAVVNLEGPIVSGAPQTPIQSFRFAFKPTTTIAVLTDIGIDALTLGNNHMYDFGAEGFKETEQHLKEASIGSFGHPLKAGLGSIATTTLSGREIVFVGFNATFPSFKIEEAVARVRNVRSEYPEALVIVEIHWGTEYAPRANMEQREYAARIANAGASLIIGHHPHVTEDLEIIDGVPVFYSLGNLIFDQYFSKDVQEGLLVRLNLKDGEPETLELLPIKSTLSQPRVLRGEERAGWLMEYAKRCPEELRKECEAGRIELPVIQ